MARPEESHSDYVQRMQLRRRQVMKAFALGGTAGVATFLLNSCANTPAASPTTAAAPTAAAAAPTAAAATPTTAAAPTAAAAASPTTAAAPTAAATAATTPTAAAAAKPTAAATAAPIADAFRMNLGSENDTDDPGRASFVNEIEVVMRVFSNSYTFDSKANLVLDQASAMPQVSSDGKTITVKLKNGLVWSDGKALSAKDWVYGTKRQLSPIVAGDYAFTLYPLVGAEEYNGADPSKTSAADLKKLRDAVGISAPDDTTIVYKLKEATPWLLQVLATWNGLPVRQDIIEAGGKPEDNQDWVVPGKYIGNGPFVMTAHDPNVQYVFQANAKYVRGVPPLSKVQMLMINDTTVALAAYKAGDLDRAGVGPLTVDAVTKDPTLSKEFTKVPGSCTFYVGFNTTIKPFDNVKVRQAFSYAMDRKTFVDQVLKGLGLPAFQFLPPGFPGYYPEITLQAFDSAKSKSTLAAAGYTNGQGLPQVKFTFSSNDTNKLVAGATQAMLQQNGNITIQQDPVEAKAFTALVKKQATTPQMFFLGWCQDYPDPQDWYSTVFESSSTVSHTGWKNADFDKACQTADVTVDAAKRTQLYQQAATILDTDTPVAFTHNNVLAFVQSPAVVGYTADPFEYFIGQHSLYTMKLNR